MKKRIFSGLGVLLLAVTSLLLTGCKTTNESDKLNIYTSIYPLTDFASKIGGNKVNVINIVPAGIEPHDFSPSAKMMIDLENSDLIIVNGLGFEAWLEDCSSNVRNKIVVASQSITPIENVLEEDDHDDHDDHDHGQYNPHVWLSIKNAKQQMLTIKNALVEKDATNADYYEANYLKYSILFDGLDSEYQKAISTFENKTIIVSHAAFGYMAKDYGLIEIAVEGLNPNSEASAKTLATITNYINQYGITAVFTQELASAKVMEQLARETNVKVLVLSPIEGMLQEEINAGEDYLSKMAANLVAIKTALSR